MINLSSGFCRQLREARRNAGLTQSELAKEVGCKQSALSMFEQGDGTKLNDEVVAKLAKKFSLSLPESAAVLPRVAGPTVPAFVAVSEKGFCPNPACPSHFGYEIEGRRYLRPDRKVQDPVGGRYCAVCGELLEHKCPNCGSPIHDGAICSLCGQPYIALA